MGDITKNFSSFELAGQGENWNEIPQEHKNNLIKIAKEIAQPARDLLGEAIHISSGYRSKKHNDAVHGALSSQHLLGKALDIFVADKTGLELFEFMLENFSAKIGGIGLYSNEKLKSKFIHIDMRAKDSVNSVVSWYCNSNGVYVSPGITMHSIANKYKITLLG